MPTSTATTTASSDVMETIQKCVFGAASTGSLSGAENSSQKSRNASMAPASGPSRAWTLRTRRRMQSELLREHDPLHLGPPWLRQRARSAVELWPTPHRSWVPSPYDRAMSLSAAPLKLPLLVLFLLVACGSAPGDTQRTGEAPSLAGCEIFPADHVWNARVDHLPVHAGSAEFVDTIGATATVHPDFGSGLWEGAPIG